MASRVGIVLQARFDSTRLRGKALASIGGESVLALCLSRLTRSTIGPVVLATTQHDHDDALAHLARRIGVEVYRGSTDDVLGRYVETAMFHEFDLVVRATGDNPGVDSDAPRRVLDVLTRHAADYACEDGLPCGAGVEIVTTHALTRSAALATCPGDREHVTLFVKRNAHTFRVTRAVAPSALQRPDLRFTVDTPADLAFMRDVFARARSVEPTLSELIAAADACPRRTAA